MSLRVCSVVSHAVEVLSVGSGLLSGKALAAGEFALSQEQPAASRVLKNSVCKAILSR